MNPGSAHEMLGFEAVCDEQVPRVVKSKKVVVEMSQLEPLVKFSVEVH